MDDGLSPLARISAAKRELLDRLLRSKLKLGGALSSLAVSTMAMSVDALRAQAVLPAAIDPLRAAPPTDGDPGDILLTGATGFLGGFLLSALLARTRARIHCLVRATDVADGHRRIADNLAHYLLPPADQRRILPIPGDLAQASLGLAAADHERLAQQIDVIHHCGAMVKWTYPYSLLRAANVTGTEEILRLACTGRVKPVHFVSTVGVFSSLDYQADVVREDEALENSGPLYVGYAQTKWVAEKLVWLAGERGLPVTVYRPNTAPDSRTGAFNRNDHVSQMVCGCIQLRAAPELATRTSGAPVDFVASAMAELSCRREAAGCAFHLVNPVDAGWDELTGWMRHYGYDVRMLPFAEWRERLVAAAVARTRSTVLASLSPLFTEQIIDKVRLPHFDQRATLKALTDSGIVCAPPGFEQFGRSLDYFVRTGFVQPPSRDKSDIVPVAAASLAGQS